MRNLEVTVNLNTTKDHEKCIYIKLNKKFLKLVWNFEDQEKDGKIGFEVEGPWGNITGVFQFKFFQESIQINIIVNDFNSFIFEYPHRR